jgi:hypothetical protein
MKEVSLMFRAMTAALVLTLSTVAAEAKTTIPESNKVKDKDGNVYAVVLDCPQSDPAFGGSEEGKLGGERCGQCLVNSNWGTQVRTPYDLTVKGVLVDEDGQPLKNRMIEFFMANGWTIKTRTTDTGFYRILMGATQERKSKENLVTDLGTKKMRKDSKASYYALFLLPENFKPCADQAKPKGSGQPKAAPKKQ